MQNVIASEAKQSQSRFRQGDRDCRAHAKRVASQ